MKVDAFLPPTSPGEVPRLAEMVEAMGFDGLWIGETSHDALLAAALAAEHTEAIDLGTAIALAFSKSPMALAYTAWDVQALARGRFILGLGSQVKGHMERRFAVPWVPPRAKMREVIRALRTIWTAWQTGEPLDFRGRHFSFSLMTPFFNPGPLEHPEVPIYLAAVNPGMARLAGELCQGLHVHPFHTVRYVQDVLKPAVREGARRAGRSAEDVTLAAPVFVAPGRTEKDRAAARRFAANQVAFYASTRTYRAVLALAGHGAVGERLHALSLQGRWDEMAGELPEAFLEEVVLTVSPEDLVPALRAKYDGVLDRLSLYVPFDGRGGWWSDFLRAWRATGA
ncbi:MAG: TIGR03617 family F420-dependent LLM class oxidoreductase [Thermoplasmata archaeon]